MDETYFPLSMCCWLWAQNDLCRFAAIIHSIFPFLFETTASDLAREITGDVKSRRDECNIPEQVEILD